jgi:benzoylformate decarboxylase
MADGFARASGKPGAGQPAQLGGHRALRSATCSPSYKNNTPLVVTAGQQARSILPHDPFLYAERPTEFPRPFVKWAIEPRRAEDVPLALIRAFATALTPPMGPVFVSIPVDDWDRECEWPALPELTLCSPPSATGVERLCAVLDGAERPALVIGTGVANCGGWGAAIRLAERTGCAVWAAPYAARETFPRTTRSSPASSRRGATRSRRCSTRTTRSSSPGRRCSPITSREAARTGRPMPS